MLFDHRDQMLLELLQKDCRLSNAELAEAVSMSPSACWRRIRAFEDAGLIDYYGAVLNPEKAGLGFQAIVNVHLTRHDPQKTDEFIRAVGLRDEVIECYALTGQADYQMRVICPDLAAYNRFLEDFLFRLSAVESAQTNVVLREIKRGKGIPITV